MERKRMQSRIRSGSILVLAVIMVVILLIIGLALMRLGLNTRLQTIRSQHVIEAKSAADAGLSQALYQMNKKRRNDIATLGAWNGAAPLPKASTPVQFSDSGQTYTYDVNGSPAAGFTMTATGNMNSGQVQRTVQGVTSLENPFSEGALIVREICSIQNMVHVSSINSSGNPLYDNVTVRIGSASGVLIAGEKPVQIGSNGNIKSDIVVGVGGNPTNLTTVGNKTDVSGKVYAMPQEFSFDPAVIPPALVSAASSSFSTDHLQTITSGKYDKIDLVQNGAGLNVFGDVSLYVTGDITTGPSCSIIVNTGSSLTIYLDGNFITRPNNDVNFVNLTGIAGNFKIYGTNPVSQNISLWPKNDFVGAIYAPNASVDFKPKGIFLGGIVCDNFFASNNFSFTYDKALSQVTINDPDAYFVINRWQEW
jgi:hypothetical protein